METSANYGFNLPNSANDDIADINQISDNFRIIDGIMNETDQTFEPTSTKAASGKAVNEAISGIQPIDENTEFIFNGGNADGAVSTDIVVDSALSKTSSNAIMNKAVATAIDNLTNAITQAKKDVLLAAYPVGSLYLTLNTIDPSTLFGGTWEAIGAGRCLIGSGYYSEKGYEYRINLGDTGGEKLHTLTVDQLPKNIGTIQSISWITESDSGAFTRTPLHMDRTASPGTDMGTTGHTLSGGGQAYNNMPPYLVVNMWKRTA